MRAMATKIRASLSFFRATPFPLPSSPLSLRSSSSHKQRARRAGGRAAQPEAHFGAVGRCSFHFPNGNSYLRYVTPSVRHRRRHRRARGRRTNNAHATQSVLPPYVCALPSSPLHSSPSHVCPLTEPAPPLPIPITTGGEVERKRQLVWGGEFALDRLRKILHVEKCICRMVG